MLSAPNSVKVEWLTEALRLSHQEEKDYHDTILKNLQATYKKLQARIDQAYIDKLDGKVSHESSNLQENLGAFSPDLQFARDRMCHDEYNCYGRAEREPLYSLYL